MGSKKTPDVPKQNLSMDLGKIFNQFQKQELPAFQRWQANTPELQQLTNFTQGTELPQLQQLLSNFPDVQKAIAPLLAIQQNQPNINQTVAPLQGVSQAFQQRMGNLMNVAPTLAQGLATQAPIIANAGQTTRDQQQAAQQQALSTFAAQGNTFGNQAALANILNQQKYKDARLQGAIQNVAGLEGIQGQDVASRLGLGQGVNSTQQAIDALRTADVNRNLALASGIQNVFGTNLAQRLGLMQGITGAITGPLTTGLSTFNSLMNPLMGFSGNVFDANQNAGAAQAIAGANAASGTTSGILSALGSILGAVALSDERLKANVRPTGEKTPEGIPIKTFTYRGEPARRFKGVMAQDVEKKVPRAVVTMPVTGHKLVNLSMIDAPFYEISKQLNMRKNAA